MTLFQILAEANSLPYGDLYDLAVQINTLLAKRKQAAAREAQRKVDMCSHREPILIEGGWHCPDCGVTRTEPRGD